jgi:hypothetical protein
MNIIDISNCPKSKLKRKAWKHAFEDTNEYLKLTVRIGFFDENGEQIITNGICEWEKELFARNSTRVNPKNGAIVLEGEDGFVDSIGEMDFIKSINLNPLFISIGNIAAINEVIYDQYIIKSDANGRFDEI